MDGASRTRIAALQARISKALREAPDDAAASTFSEYMPGATVALQDELLRAGEAEGIAGIEAILDAFDRLRSTTDSGALRHALSVILTHHATFVRLGLRLPSLEERSPWKTRPGDRR